MCAINKTLYVYVCYNIRTYNINALFRRRGGARAPIIRVFRFPRALHQRPNEISTLTRGCVLYNINDNNTYDACVDGDNDVNVYGRCDRFSMIHHHFAFMFYGGRPIFALEVKTVSVGFHFFF